MAGLRFEYKSTPPGVFPKEWTYFQISRDSQHEEWEDVRKSLTLAIRLKEKQIKSSTQGQPELKIDIAGQTHTMKFSLFLIRGD
jgi:type VI secretion system protein ImpJ